MSEESKILLEDEFIELFKFGFIDMFLLEYLRDSFEVFEDD